MEIWNSIPGFTAVKKFTDRKTAVARIWKAIQNLDGGVGAPAANIAPEKSPRGRRAKPAQKETRAARGSRVKKEDKAGESVQAAVAAATAARPGSKTAGVIVMLRKAEGATLQQIMHATGWQAHSVRGFISGTVGKKMGLRVESAKPEDGERSYSISD